MPHFAVASTRDFDAAVRRAGNAALGLWTRAGAWSVARLTDGVIPREVAEDLGTAPQIRRLLAAGLWEETPDGYAFTTWESDGNRTRIEVESVSESRRNAGRSGGIASGKSRNRTPDSSGVTAPDLQEPEASASSKTNPLPSPTLPYPPLGPTAPDARASAPASGGALFARPKPAAGRDALPDDLRAVVQAWERGAEATASTKELRQITGSARERLGAGISLDDLMAGAEIAGAEGGFTDITRSVHKARARRRPAQPQRRRLNPAEERMMRTQALKENPDPRVLQALAEHDGTAPPGRVVDADVVELRPAVGGGS